MSCFCLGWLAPPFLSELILLCHWGCRYLMENVLLHALICFIKPDVVPLILTQNFLPGVLWASMNGHYILMWPLIKTMVKAWYDAQAKCSWLGITQKASFLSQQHIHNLMNSLSCLSNFIGTVLQQRAKKIALDELLMCIAFFTSVRPLTFQF